MIYYDAYPSPIWCNSDFKDDKIYELWLPCWYNKVGVPGRMYKQFGFLDDFLIGPFLEIDEPGTINVFLGLFSNLDSSNIVSWLHRPKGTV